jgi:hypothetical protein
MIDALQVVELRWIEKRALEEFLARLIVPLRNLACLIPKRPFLAWSC